MCVSFGYNRRVLFPFLKKKREFSIANNLVAFPFNRSLSFLECCLKKKKKERGVIRIIFSAKCQNTNRKPFVNIFVFPKDHEYIYIYIVGEI